MLTLMPRLRPPQFTFQFAWEPGRVRIDLGHATRVDLADLLVVGIERVLQAACCACLIRVVAVQVVLAAMARTRSHWPEPILV